MKLPDPAHPRPVVAAKRFARSVVSAAGYPFATAPRSPIMHLEPDTEE